MVKKSAPELTPQHEIYELVADLEAGRASLTNAMTTAHLVCTGDQANEILAAADTGGGISFAGRIINDFDLKPDIEDLFNLSGSVEGHLRVLGAVGGNLEVSGSVVRDIKVFGSVGDGFAVSGSVGGDLTVFASVGSDLIVFGKADGNVTVFETGSVGGDLIVFETVGGNVTLFGAVDGNLAVEGQGTVGGHLEVLGLVGGSVTVSGSVGGRLGVSGSIGDNFTVRDTGSTGENFAVWNTGSVGGNVTVAGSVDGAVTMFGSINGALTLSGSVNGDVHLDSPEGEPQHLDGLSVRTKGQIFVGARIDLTYTDFRGFAGYDNLRFSNDRHFRTGQTGRQHLAFTTSKLLPHNISNAEQAGIYRQLRAALEKNSNRPAASDFYYGETEARRKAAVERSRTKGWFSPDCSVLYLYRKISAYGTRSLRTFAWFFSIALLFSLFYAVNGVDLNDAYAVDRESFTNGGWDWGERFTLLLFTVRSMVSFFSPPNGNLSPAEGSAQLALRFIGPLLLAQAVLAIRDRVAR